MLLLLLFLISIFFLSNCLVTCCLFILSGHILHEMGKKNKLVLSRFSLSNMYLIKECGNKIGLVVLVLVH